MSGHSKWHNIKRRKEVTDAKKGTAFTKFSTEIASAARAGGTDASHNATLRDVIERSRKAGFPQANIDRLLGKQENTTTQTVTYEGFGPGGAGLIILARTDNPNRTVANLRTLLKDYGGSLGTPHSVAWKFTLDSSTGEYHTKYLQPLDETTHSHLTELLHKLESMSDIERIFTDTVQ